MKNFKTFLLLLLAIPFFISCEKDEPEISKECILLDGKFFDGILFYEVINSTDARVKFVDENYREEKIVIPHKIKFDENVFLVTEIDSYAFSGCSGLTSIEIPNSVTSIGDRAFSDCSGLTSIEIPNSVTSIGNRAFRGCSSLTSIEIPNSVTSIRHGAFSGCSGLTSVVWNMVNCADFSSDPELFENAAKITSFTFGESVKFIPSYLCKDMSKLTSIEIPNSVTSIGDRVFSGCSSLTSIEIPNSVTSIGEYWVFSDCSGLTSIVVEAGNPVYDSRENCNAIIETETNKLIAGCQNSFIPNSVTSIGICAFADCSGLTSIEIPNSVTSIGKYAFSDCSGLTSVVWNAIYCRDIYDYRYSPFEGSTENITSFVFGDSVQYIPAYLCNNMSKLTSIEIPNSVISIGNNAFSDCSGLTSIEIPNSVISIGNNAFSDCSGLTNVVWNAINCRDIYDRFEGSTENITSFIFGNSVQHIPAYLCHGMSNLTSIEIPNSVTSIGYEAFYGCSGLTSVVIGKSVTFIGEYAFVFCNGIEKIKCKPTYPPTCESNSPFSEYVYRGANLEVPIGSKNSYKNSEGWSQFRNIIEKDFSEN